MNNINITNIFDSNYNFTKALDLQAILSSNNKYTNDPISSDTQTDTDGTAPASTRRGFADTYSVKNFSVKNLTPKTNNISKLTDDYIVNKIKYNEAIDKNKLLELYETKYNESLIKINNAIDIGITDIFFTVPDAFFGYKFYTPMECLEFAQKKLRNKNFDTLIINNTTMFISWKNLILFNRLKNSTK
jgi:hypothetical protein